MPVFGKLSALCAAGIIAAHLTSANPILTRRDGDGLAAKLPQGINRGKCAPVNNWDSTEQRKTLWTDANGWELVDRFLDQNSGFAPGWTEHWGSRIYRELFPTDGTKMDCDGHDGAECDHNKDCGAYAAAGWPGIFYVMESLSNIYSYFDAYNQELENLKAKLERDIPTMIDSLGANRDAAKQLPVGDILIFSMDLLSQLTEANPGVSGSLSALSAFTGLFQDKLNGEDPPDPAEAAEDALRNMITSIVGKMKNEVTIARDAIFGNAIYRPSREHYDPKTSEFRNEFTEIPDDMKFNRGAPGTTDGWNHPITYVLGDGQWLSAHPAADLPVMFQDLYKQIRQRIAVELLKSTHGAVVVINEGDSSPENCANAGSNNQWDDAPDRNYCYGIMWVENGNLKGGINDAAYALWDNYDAMAANDVSSEGSRGFGMGRIETYRNILDCWHMNNGHNGNLDANYLQAETGLPRCFFSMEVKKGNWVDDNDDCWTGKTLALDTGFLNFPSDSDDFKNKRTHWPQEKPLMSPFCSNQ
ncbi:hypothetical protein BDV96DRAFT_567053 [Lophiotrema nucula]|uniref:Uncharacterized protein n=1 Tax=Lophiotrema nucula TaxID=690887 RepID=A0A6A5ZL13_9PLEO|nr:hypothetical protein BDV96DRAFT_567053 [Lophiotrema nucula]